MMDALHDPSITLPSDEPALLNNWQALEKLEQERNQLTTNCYIAAGLTAGLALTTPVLMAMAFPVFRGMLPRLQKTSQICTNMGLLLKAFESQGVIITPDLKVPDNGALDLFVRFPNSPKANFAIGLRSNGHSSVFYNKEKENLYRRRQSGGLKPWQVDLFRRIGLQEFWLRKNRQALFGQSSKDRNRAVVKVLVLTGETKLGKHPEQMYAIIGDQKVLLVQKRVAVYILEERQQIPFVKAWLAQHAQPQ
ncbi:MAG: hypothetical protein HC936_07820 [Leptolyngbyaceae cyanobacterium SU_3_3]|nr:hypothetical protein [Leptolyngbyaceae cyanobacterium SU_3_3]NJR50653.1 hypothetical protein [Leptolyngbyaceae cyanobacterium CSU_1_3]